MKWRGILVIPRIRKVSKKCNRISYIWIRKLRMCWVKCIRWIRTIREWGKRILGWKNIINSWWRKFKICRPGLEKKEANTSKNKNTTRSKYYYWRIKSNKLIKCQCPNKNNYTINTVRSKDCLLKKWNKCEAISKV